MPFDPQQMYNKISILTITITAILLYLVLFAFYIYLCFKLHKNLKPKFGVLWDENKEPYCPICKNPLGRHTTKRGGSAATGLKCVKCKESLLLVDKGKKITLEEAKKLL